MKDVKVGDILAGRWGYSMVLYAFYEVEKVTEKQVALRELNKRSLGGEQWSERVEPVLGSTYDKRKFRVRNDITKDYLWDSKLRSLIYPYDPNREYIENHMD